MEGLGFLDGLVLVEGLLGWTSELLEWLGGNSEI
jgi:hypothetical protein